MTMGVLNLRSRWRRFGGDERGVALVEFAFIVPILALFVMAIVDLSQGFAQRMTMQQAVNRGLELLLVHPPTAEDDDSAVDYSGIRQEVATAAGVPVSQVTLTEFLMCDGTRAGASATTCATGEDAARYIQLTVNQNFTGKFYVDSMTLTATGSMRIQ